MDRAAPARRTEALVFAWVVALSGWPIFLGVERFVSLLYDDAFYYTQIARHAAAGDGLTFDGLHATTGFQPLWQWLLVPIVGAVPGDLAPLKVILLLEVALTATAALGVLRALAPRVGRTPALAAALLLAAQPGATGTFFSGMESALLLALLVAGWRAWLALAAQEADGAECAWARLGALCALCVLARLEAAALLVVIALVERRRLAASPRRAALLLAPAALALGAVLAWNHARVGLWFPVSGVVKARAVQDAVTLGERLRFLWSVPWFGQQAVVAALGNVQPPSWPRAVRLGWQAGLFVGGAALLAGRRRVLAAFARAGVGVPLAAGALIVLLDKLVVAGIEPWERVALLLANALLFATVLAGRRRLALAGVALALVAGAATLSNAVVSIADPTLKFGHYRRAAADWLRAHTGEDERAGSRTAGEVAWFSHRTIVNLDGLVNDGAFYRRVVVGHALADYLAEERIVRIVDQLCGGTTSFAAYVPGTEGDALAAAYPPEVVLHNERTPDGCPGEVVWRRRASPR